MKSVLLLADNNKEFRETYEKILSEAGYDVKLAANPDEARRILQDIRVDLAILDVKLIDDNNDKDFSGLDIAIDKAFRHIPKVILTVVNMTYEGLRRALGFTGDELPPALAFVGKGEGPKALLDVIRQTLETWPRLRMSTVKISEQTKADYETARRQAIINYGVAFAISIIGFLVIFAGICLAWLDKLTIGIVGTASGIVLQALSYLFFKRLDLANDRMDIYHRELLQTYWLELLMSACEQLPSERQVVCTERAICVAMDRWFSAHQLGKEHLTSKGNQVES